MRLYQHLTPGKYRNTQNKQKYTNTCDTHQESAVAKNTLPPNWKPQSTKNCTYISSYDSLTLVTMLPPATNTSLKYPKKYTNDIYNEHVNHATMPISSLKSTRNTVPELKIDVTAMTGGCRAAEKVDPGSRDARHFFFQGTFSQKMTKKTAEICTKTTENFSK